MPSTGHHTLSQDGASAQPLQQVPMQPPVICCDFLQHYFALLLLLYKDAMCFSKIILNIATLLNSYKPIGFSVNTF